MGSIIAGIEPSSRPLIVACSPRERGNCDHGAQLLADALTFAGANPRVVHLRDLDIRLCNGCQACGKGPEFACVHRGDEAQSLFGLMIGAPALFFVSPVYFYHVPALFKAFIDRSQRYYMAKVSGDVGLAGLPRRVAHVVLLGGRERGDRLFEGAFITLKYFLWSFNVDLGESCCLYGVDGPGDLAADEGAAGRVAALAGLAWKAA